MEDAERVTSTILKSPASTVRAPSPCVTVTPFGKPLTDPEISRFFVPLLLTLSSTEELLPGINKILFSSGPVNDREAYSFISNIPLALIESTPLLVEESVKFSCISPTRKLSIITSITTYTDSPLSRFTGSGFVNVTPAWSIPIIDSVSDSVPSFLITTLNVSIISTSSLIESGITIDRPHISPMVIEKLYSSTMLVSMSKLPLKWNSQISPTYVSSCALIITSSW